MDPEASPELERRRAYWEKVLPPDREPSLDIVTGESAIRPPEYKGDKASRAIRRRALRDTFAPNMPEATTDNALPLPHSEDDSQAEGVLRAKEEILERLRAKGVVIETGLVVEHEECRE